MRRRSDGEAVDPHDVLDASELADHYRQHPPRPTTGYEALNLGADPAVVSWIASINEVMRRCTNTGTFLPRDNRNPFEIQRDDHLERGQE